MNQEKIGKFISIMRKKKDLTQEQFAEKVKNDIEEVKDNQKELTDKIDSIEQKPYKDWTKVKSTIITGVATAVGTGAIIYLINFLFNTNL